MPKADAMPYRSPDAVNLQLALEWLAHLVSGYLSVHFGKATSFKAQSLEFCSEDSPLELFIKSQDPTLEEFALVMIALAPHLRPGFFNTVISELVPEGGTSRSSAASRGPITAPSSPPVKRHGSYWPDTTWGGA